MNSKNSFLFAINIRCEPSKFEKLLMNANINFFHQKIEKTTFYYDEMTYFVFDSSLNRQEFFDKLNSHPSIKEEINEIQFCEREVN